MVKTSSFSITMTALLFLWTQNSFAISRIKYVGLPFETTDAGPGNLTMTIQFKEPLVPLDVLYDSDIAFFGIIAAGRAITNWHSPSYVHAEFRIGADLIPTSWVMAVEKQIEGDPSRPEAWTSRLQPVNHSGQNLDIFGIDDLNENHSSTIPLTFSEIVFQPGTWILIPEPTTYALALAALCLAMGRRRIYSRCTAVSVS